MNYNMHTKDENLPPIAVYIPVVLEDIELAIDSLEQIKENSKNTDKFIVVGLSKTINKIQKRVKDDGLVIFIGYTGYDLSAGRMWQLITEKFAGYDLIRVTAGTLLPSSWDKVLQESAYQDIVIGSISPFCNESVLFGLLRTNELEQIAADDLNLINAILQKLWVKKIFQVPVFLPNIAFIKSSVLTEIFSPDDTHPDTLDDSDISELIYSKGYINVISGNVYVHESNKNTKLSIKKIDDRPDVKLMNAAYPISVLRYMASDALTKHPCVREIQPVQLHIMHSWGGGLHNWVRHYCDGDKLRRNLVLKSIGDWDAFGKRLALFDHPDASEPIKYWDLRVPIQAIDIHNLEYREILKEVIDQFGVDVIWVSSLIGHSLDIFNTAVKTGFIYHDYLPFCPAINIYYNGVCNNCDSSRLDLCFENNEHNRFFKHHTARQWIAIRHQFSRVVLSNNIKLVVPLPSVKDHILTLQPELSSVKFTVIPHGHIENMGIISETKVSNDGDNFRIVVLGELTPHKGLALLKSVVNQLPSNMHVYLLGCGHAGEAFKKYNNITIFERYSHSELHNIITDINADIGLLLSIWPETFSYTLSELMAFRIPTVATRLGAFQDRITDGVNGFLVEPDPRELLSLLNSLSKDTAQLQRVRNNLKTTTSRSLFKMVADYHVTIDEPFYNSLATVYVGEQKTAPVQYQEGKTKLILSHELDLAIKEFGGFVKIKVKQSNRFNKYSKRAIMLMMNMWLLFPMLIGFLKNK